MVWENQRVGKSTANGEHRVRLVDVDWTRVLLYTLIALLLCSIARLGFKR
jgi:hypothetical protein